MNRKIAILFIINSFCLFLLVKLISKGHYLYNAYSPGYDEYFVIKSYQVLPLDTIVHFNDNAGVTKAKTGFTCKILSPYIKK